MIASELYDQLFHSYSQTSPELIQMKSGAPAKYKLDTSVSPTQNILSGGKFLLYVSLAFYNVCIQPLDI